MRGSGCRRYRVYLDYDISQSLVRLAISRGVVELWVAEPAGLSSTKDSVKCVAGDAANRVFLRRFLGRNTSLSLQLDFSVQVEPALIFRCPASDPADSMVALLVNGECLGVARPQGDGFVRFVDVGKEDYLRIVAALAAVEPWACGWRVVEYSKMIP